MPSYSMELYEAGNDNSNSDTTSSKAGLTKSRSLGNGFYVSTLKAFIFVLLAALVAVGVGIIAFVAQTKEVACNFAEYSDPGSAQRQCQGWITQGGETAEKICNVCSPSSVTTSAPEQTTPAPSANTTDATTTTTAAPGYTREEYRLPGKVVPIHYTLKLKPDIYGTDPSTFTFEGSVIIEVECKVDTDWIYLHADRLEINNNDVTVTAKATGENIVAHPTYNKELHFFSMHVMTMLVAGQRYLIEFKKFSGPLTMDGQGLYYSFYREGDQTVYLATTQMEAPYARKSFPCFDEPALKAVFDVTLVRKTNIPRTYVTLSNMPLKTSTAVGDWIEDSYESTPIMSTYLLAFIVCDYTYLQNITNGTDYRTWARGNAIEYAKRAQEHGLKIFEYLNSHFKPSYNSVIPKLDNIAIPDFNAGAMENWGLITYREALLYKPGVAGATDDNWIAEVVAHEIAHMWFGDLVSPLWWDWLWLNEAFASFWDFHTVGEIYPSWRTTDEVVASGLHSVMATDCLASSHPMTATVGTRAEISSIFDSITYTKGSFIVRMMHFIMGQDKFIEGLNIYLDRKKFSSAEHKDLWNALNEVGSSMQPAVNMTLRMDPWVTQMGYPVVTVTKASGGTLRLTQQRFLLGSENSTDDRYKDAPYNYKWEIPITYTTSEEKNFNKTRTDITWLTKDRAAEISDSRLSQSDWYIVNIQQVGYFRVNYEAQNWQALITQLNTDHTVFHPINRGQLINDAWNLVKANLLDMSVALQLLDYLSKETDYVAWQAFAREMNYVELMLDLTPLFGDLEAFILKTVNSPLNSLGLVITPDLPPIEVYVRSLIADYACSYGHDTCVKMAKQQFSTWMTSSTNSIDPNLRFRFYCTALQNGGSAEWNFVYKQYKAEDDAIENSRLRRALACTKDPSLLQRLLSMTLNSSEIRTQDIRATIQVVAENRWGRNLAFNFVIQYFTQLNGMMSASNMNRLIASITAPFNSEYHLTLLQNLLDVAGTSGYQPAISQARAQTETNRDWLKKHYAALESWLTSETTDDDKPVRGRYRLPTNVKPISYTVTIAPYIYGNDSSKFHFEGSCTILVECKSSTSTITLHVDRLNIDLKDVTVTQENGIEILLDHVSYESETHFYRLHLKSSLTPGNNYRVTFAKFSGPLRNDGQGLYVSAYRDGDRTVYLATTQMEAPYARKTFPCFDEPALKARFNFNLLRRVDAGRNYTTLFNTQRNDTRNFTDSDGHTWANDTFETTPIMPTYLLAFIVCDYLYVENTTTVGKPIPYRTWARPNAIQWTQRAQEYGLRLYNWFNTNFKPDYATAISKLDHVAVPDFNFGAMENWGLIIYREAILYQPGVTSASYEFWMGGVIAHEIAHMWFGDIVSPMWWDYLWLNEAFASWWDVYGTDQVLSQWRCLDKWIADDIHSVMVSDALATSHPITSDVETPAEINAIFDGITYNKGAAILRMIQFVMGETNFFEALNTRYLHQNLWDNAEPSDLWEAFDKQMITERLNVTDKMDPWISQMGFPVVRVTKIQGAAGYLVTQERFLLGSEADTDPRYKDTPYNYKWNIPIVYTDSVAKDFNQSRATIHWLDRNVANITIGQSVPNDNDAWILLNVQQIGYFRVLYDDDNWYALIRQLNKDLTVIPPINRGQIINDAWNLAKAGMLNMSIALATLDFLQQEREYVPWRAFAREMNYVELMLERTDLYPALTRFMLETVSQPLKTLSLNITEGMVPIGVFIRTLIAEYACKYGHISCVNDARRKFREWKNTGVNEINANLRRQFYCTGVADGDSSDWEFVYQQYKINDDTTELTNLRYAMSCSKDVNLLRRLLSMVLDGNEIRPQDVSTTIQWVAGNSVGRDPAFQFLINNFEAVKDKLEVLYLGRTFLSVTSHFNTEFDLQQLTQFSATSASSVIRTFVDEAIAQTRTNMGWLQTNYDVIAAWLNNRGAAKPPPPAGNYRLPGDLMPIHYNLRLQPDIYGTDPSKFTFSGRVSIDFTCVKETNSIILHQDRLEIDSTVIRVIDETGAQLEISGFEDEKQFHFYRINLKQSLEVGKNYSVIIPQFTGKIRSNGEGLYWSSYVDGGQRIYLATTQMEATYARQVFPCFDEPAMKATFNTVLVRQRNTGRNYITLSNMPLKGSNNTEGNWTEDHFERTMVMPTYLLAFIVCDYKFLSDMAEGGVNSSTYARPNRIEDAKTAQKYGVEVFNWYNRNFKPNYTTYLSKVDHIAIPDFNAGAMENWGLITYREALLYNNMSTASDLAWVAEVISHELAHMWFGNKVSPQWWDWLWLNEAFASYWEYYAVWQLYPNWKNNEVELTASVFSAMQIDSYSTSHPLTNPVETPEEIDLQFSTITYTKGGAIISMMHFIMGEEFIPALNEYLKGNAEGSANHTTLLSTLDEYSQAHGLGIDMTLRMEPWIKQMGYPVVTVTRNGNDLQLKQERFLLGTSPSSDVGEFRYKYEVPISYTTNIEQNFNKSFSKTWLTKDQDLNLNIPDQWDWVIVNVQHKGYFRVNYDEANWKALINQLNTNHTVIHEINRATIIDDAFNLVKAGHLDLKIALQTIDYLSKETSYGAWRTFARETTQLDMLIERTDLFPAFQRFMQKIVDTPLNKVGLDMSIGNDPPIEMYTRTWIVRDACYYEHPTCVKVATEAVSDWMATLRNGINVNLRSDMYCTAVRDGSHDVWDFIFKMYQKETHSAERTRLRNSLGCSKDPSILRRFLEMCLYDNSIPMAETSACVSAVAGNRFGRDVAVNFVMEKFPDIKSQFSASALGSMVRTVTQHFHTNYHLALIKFLRDTYDVYGITTQLQLAEQTTLTNMRFLQNNFQTIKEWLDSKAPAPSTRLDYRLPTSIIPLHYNLALQPEIYGDDPKSFTFNGSVSIDIECVSATSSITLHAYRLSVDRIRSSASLTDSSGTIMTSWIKEVTYDEPRHFLTFHLTRDLTSGGRYILFMEFSGQLLGDGVGLYYASYTDGSQTVYMATTKFEAPYARRAFPCFDEPALKATFNTTLVRRAEYNYRKYNSRSNNELIDSVPLSNGYVADSFRTTLNTSTYLLAFIISDFKCLENTTQNNLIYRTCARPNAYLDGQLAQEWGVREMDWLEHWFNPNYSMPKLDNIAIPNFLSGAMENWGLITYRETLLYTQNLSTASDQNWMVEVVAHELAHMWFGNIVSPKWWNWLWLNEAFASFFDYHIVDQLERERRHTEQFLVQALHSTMASDSLYSSHPLTADVESPDEIQAIFDSITYNKGSAIVRMMHFIMGENDFFGALNVYLENRQYNVADHDDLWNALDEYSSKKNLNLNMTDLMDPWVTQMGYPVVNVKRNGADKIVLTQKRFVTSTDGTPDEGEYGYKWDIPVTVVTSDNPDFNVGKQNITWFYRHDSEITIDVPPAPAWVIVNVQQYGYFRVNYENQMWQQIIRQLNNKSSVIHAINRAQIINDAWSLAKKGDLDMSTALDTITFLKTEEDYLPWRAITSELTHLDLMLSTTDLYGQFQNFMKEMVNETFVKFENTEIYSNETPIIIFQRQRITSYACDYGIEQCKNMATTKFSEYRQNPTDNKINVDLRYIIYCNGIRYGTQEDWEFLLKEYKNTSSSSERSNIQRGLACTRDPWLINRFLKLTLDSSVIKPQDVRLALESVSANPSGRDRAWTFLKENFVALSKSSTPSNFGRMILYLTQHFNTGHQLKEVRQFMNDNDVTIAESTFRQVLEQTTLNIQWISKYLDDIKAWLDKQ